MAQVEFLSVVWRIWGEWRVDANVAGEGREEGKRRLRRVMDESEPRLTLQMKRPRDAVMRWRRR